MSGVSTLSRLERLEQLVIRVTQERDQERLRLATDCRVPATRPAQVVKVIPADRCALLELGVAPAVVRSWAQAVGLIPSGTRGRLAVDVINAYAEAHPMQRVDA